MSGLKIPENPIAHFFNVMIKIVLIFRLREKNKLMDFFLPCEVELRKFQAILIFFSPAILNFFFFQLKFIFPATLYVFLNAR